MYRLLKFLCLFAALSCAQVEAQDFGNSFSLPSEAPGTNRVYAELLGYGTNFLGLNKNVNVTVDLGQFQSAFKSYEILDENGKPMKFNSMVAAMNYMGERGWKFIQAYVVTVSNQNVYHWLLYKDVTDRNQIYDGLSVNNTDSAPEKASKIKKKKSKSYRDADPLYGE